LSLAENHNFEARGRIFFITYILIILNTKLILNVVIFFQLSETVADDRGISARIGRPWTTGGDVPVDRLMWQAVCVVGRRLANIHNNNNNNNNNNNTCLPVIKF
jgi:hypothetical protein